MRTKPIMFHSKSASGKRYLVSISSVCEDLGNSQQYLLAVTDMLKEGDRESNVCVIVGQWEMEGLFELCTKLKGRLEALDEPKITMQASASFLGLRISLVPPSEVWLQVRFPDQKPAYTTPGIYTSWKYYTPDVDCLLELLTVFARLGETPWGEERVLSGIDVTAPYINSQNFQFTRDYSPELGMSAFQRDVQYLKSLESHFSKLDDFISKSILLVARGVLKRYTSPPRSAFI